METFQPARAGRRTLQEIETKRRSEEKARREREDQEERKILRELERLEASTRVDPPPELLPAQKKEREIAERLDRLEGCVNPIPTDLKGFQGESVREHRLKVALRIMRERKASEDKQRREREDGTAKRREVWEREQGTIVGRFAARVRQIEVQGEAAIDQARAERENALEKLGVARNGIRM